VIITVAIVTALATVRPASVYSSQSLNHSPNVAKGFNDLPILNYT
jgi:hypothetical protein